jgi:hypothetical protein
VAAWSEVGTDFFIAKKLKLLNDYLHTHIKLTSDYFPLTDTDSPLTPTEYHYELSYAHIGSWEGLSGQNMGTIPGDVKHSRRFGSTRLMLRWNGTTVDANSNPSIGACEEPVFR